jgi:hypothetical protein
MNFGDPSDDWPLRMLLSFRDRTLSALAAELSSSSLYTQECVSKNIINILF